MDSNSEDTPGLSSSCSLCLRTLTSDNDTTDFEAVNMCSDCNFLVLEDLDSPMRDVYHWRSFGLRRTRYNSSAESIGNLFPQQVSYVFNLAREHQDNMLEHDDHSVDADGGSRSLQCTSSRATPSGSWRSRRVLLSDTESDRIGSSIAESESNVRFRGQSRVVDGENESISYGWSSNASDDGSSLLGIENSAYEGSDVHTDTDIDPMHAGMYHWDSDDQEEDGNGWEEAGSEETIFGGRSRQRSLSFTESTWSRLNNILSAESEDVDGHEFDELAEHLSDADGLRRGAPPAAASVINSLPRVVVIKNQEEHLDGMVCAICKDSLSVETIVNQLPCSHLYHPSCIVPWLSSRNTCPLCRYELPTDDQEYEGKKHGNREIQQSGMNGDGSSDVVNAGSEAISTGGSRSGGPQGRWYSIAAAAAAAPVISVVGIALVLWLGNPLTEPRRRSSVLKVFSSHRQPSNLRGRRRWNLL